MPLTTVFFPKFNPDANELPYRKAFIDPSDMEFFLKLGAVTSPKNIKFDAEKAKSIDENTPFDTDDLEQSENEEASSNIADMPTSPDKGHGRPGGYRYHAQVVMGLEDFNSVNRYVEGVTGKPLDREYSTLQYSKTKALAAIKEFVDDDNG